MRTQAQISGQETTRDKVFSLVRHIFTFAGAYLIGHNLFGQVVDQDTLQVVLGVILSVGGLIWSIIDKTVTIEMIQGAVRQSVSLVGGFLVSSGKLSPEHLETITGVLLFIISYAQGIISRQKAKQILTGEITPLQLKH